MYSAQAILKTVAAVSVAALLYATELHAASCCGGGSASSLILPKSAGSMLDLSVDTENYHGFWNNQGLHVSDPPGSVLSQTRLNAGVGYRLTNNWQTSLVLPYVWNDNKYAGFTSKTHGLGDATASLWYEAFEGITCVWKVNSLADLKPSMYYGLTMTVPTGVSPYDKVTNSFDITGRGFYRLDASVLIDKTIFPWNATFQYSYGVNFARPVNREYGNYIEPYEKNLGDRTLGLLSFGYSYQTETAEVITTTLAYSDLQETAGEIDGQADPTGGLSKESLALTIAYSNFKKDWIYKLTVSQATAGHNFPQTDVISLGVSHVYF